jgi:transcriptional regulator with XRE-family HTH domain
MHILRLTFFGHMVHIHGMTNLAQWMRQSGVKDRAVADYIGRDRSIVSRIRRGELMPTLTIAVALERLTGGDVPASSWIKDEHDTA